MVHDSELPPNHAVQASNPTGTSTDNAEEYAKLPRKQEMDTGVLTTPFTTPLFSYCAYSAPHTI